MFKISDAEEAVLINVTKVAIEGLKTLFVVIPVVYLLVNQIGG